MSVCGSFIKSPKSSVYTFLSKFVLFLICDILLYIIAVGIYLFKVASVNTGKMWEICSVLTIKTCGVVDVVSVVVLVSLLLTLKRVHTLFWSLRKNCPYSEFFWSVFSPNAGKCGPEKLRIRTLFTGCVFLLLTLKK